MPGERDRLHPAVADRRVPVYRAGFANTNRFPYSNMRTWIAALLPVSRQTHMNHRGRSAWLRKRIEVQVLAATDLPVDSCNAKCNYIRYPCVIFEWDEQKREPNVAKHAIDFADCEEVFAGPTVSVWDDRFAYGEQRFVTLGLLAGRVVAVAHTQTTEIIRVISMRKATRHEQALFFEALQN